MPRPWEAFCAVILAIGIVMVDPATAGPIRPGQSPGARVGGFTSFGSPVPFSPTNKLTNRMRSNAGGTALIDSVGGASPTKSAGSTFVSDAGAPTAAPYILRQATASQLYTLPITPQGSATYAAWVYWATTPSTVSGVMGEAKATSSASFQPWALYVLSTGAVRLTFNGTANAASSAALAAATWHHVVVTFDCPSTCTTRLYVDGAMVGTAMTGLTQRDLTGTRITNAFSATSDAPTAQTLIGDLQEVDVYAGYAMSSGEVQSLYNLGRNGW